MQSARERSSSYTSSMVQLLTSRSFPHVTSPTPRKKFSLKPIHGMLGRSTVSKEVHMQRATRHVCDGAGAGKPASRSPQVSNTTGIGEQARTTATSAGPMQRRTLPVQCRQASRVHRSRGATVHDQQEVPQPATQRHAHPCSWPSRCVGPQVTQASHIHRYLGPTTKHHKAPRP